LRFGAETSSQRDWAMTALSKLETKVRVAPLPVVAGAHYGQIRAKLENAGHMIGENDLFLAAHARAQGCIFVTPNSSVFTLIDGLQIENRCELV
jgi:tRNA(fMet)-specific endonuclease VapC